MIVETAELIKDYLIENTDLDQIQIAVQIDQQNGRDRAVNDAAPADLAEIKVDVDAVLLIQSANVMSEPRSLARLYAAVKSGVPIIPAVMTSAAAEHKSLLYNFEAAKPHMMELSRHLDDDAVVALEAALVEGAGGEKVDTVGIHDGHC